MLSISGYEPVLAALDAQQPGHSPVGPSCERRQAGQPHVSHSDFRSAEAIARTVCRQVPSRSSVPIPRTRCPG